MNITNTKISGKVLDAYLLTAGEYHKHYINIIINITNTNINITNSGKMLAIFQRLLKIMLYFTCSIFVIISGFAVRNITISCIQSWGD